jgi:hypothetical protein
LDPRAKIRGFHNILRILSGLTGTDYSAFFSIVRSELTATFNKLMLSLVQLNYRGPLLQHLLLVRGNNNGAGSMDLKLSMLCLLLLLTCLGEHQHLNCCKQQAPKFYRFRTLLLP